MELDKEKYDDIVKRINDVVETYIQPAVESHGGIVKLEDFDMESGKALMLMSGSCSGCASSTITLKLGVENMLKHYVPEVTGVEGMDDPSYNDPYYRADDGRGYAVWDQE